MKVTVRTCTCFDPAPGKVTRVPPFFIRNCVVHWGWSSNRVNHCWRFVVTSSIQKGKRGARDTFE